MKKYGMPIYIALFFLGATALWYFGHHRPAQKTLEAEPKKVYKTTRLPPRDLSVKPTPSDAIQAPREADTDIAVEGTDNPAMAEKIDGTQGHSEDGDSVAPISQEATSAEDAAAAEAHEKYLTAEADYQAAKERLMEAFPLYTDQVASATEETKEALAESDHQAIMEGLNKALVSLEHIDFDQIRAATEAYKEAKLRRKEALENFAPYSEDAAKMLAQVKEDEKRAAERAAEAAEKAAEYDSKIREIEDKVRKTDERLESFLESLRSK